VIRVGDQLSPGSCRTSPAVTSQSSLRFLRLATIKVVRSSSGYKTPHNFRQPEKITHDSSSGLYRPGPFSQLGFSEWYVVCS
jgi:hypothetical protein